MSEVDALWPSRKARGRLLPTHGLRSGVSKRRTRRRRTRIRRGVTPEEVATNLRHVPHAHDALLRTHFHARNAQSGGPREGALVVEYVRDRVFGVLRRDRQDVNLALARPLGPGDLAHVLVGREVLLLSGR